MISFQTAFVLQLQLLFFILLLQTPLTRYILNFLPKAGTGPSDQQFKRIFRS